MGNYRQTYHGKGGQTMIDTTQLQSMRKAGEYLGKKRRQKKIRRNLIIGLIFLAAFILLIMFY